MKERVHTLSQNLTNALKDLGYDALNSFHYWRHNLKGNRVEKRYFSGKSDHPPVILLQGFMGTRGVLKPLEDYLRHHGRDVISLDLGFFNIGDIRESSELLNYKIERIFDRFAESHGFKQVDIIGHSMGGLIGLYYIKRLGGHRLVRKMIALGAPFKGTWSSLLGLFPIGLVSKGIWQMVPGSKFLRGLQVHTEELHQTQVFSIAAKYDSICPPKTCHLRGANNAVIPVGHASLLVDERVFQEVLGFLSSHEGPTEDSKVIPFTNKRSR